MATDEPVQVEDDPARQRYEARLGGEVAGFLTYRRTPERTVLVHTEVDDRFEGRGVGSRLVTTVLDAERAQGHSIEPRCPFVAAYIRRHREYVDIVPEQYRAPAGL